MGGNFTVISDGGVGTFTTGYAGGSAATLTIGNGSTMSVDRIFISEAEWPPAVNLNSGGILDVANYRKNNSAGTATLNFNGGTLRVKSAEADGELISNSIDTANILAGGLTVDTNGFTARILEPLMDGGGAGGLTKTGNGTLILQASGSTYTGATVVNAGNSQIGNGGATGSIGKHTDARRGDYAGHLAD